MVLQRRHGGVLLFATSLLAASLGVRLLLFAEAAREVSWDWTLGAAFAWGLLYDLGTVAWLSLPVIALLTVLPAGVLRRRGARVAVVAAAWLVACAAVFDGIAEWVFWREFETRFNFITVDYLVYTQEVFDNIRESYPLPLVGLVVATTAAALTWAAWRTGWAQAWMAAPAEPWRRRVPAGLAWTAGALAIAIGIDSAWLPDFPNRYHREIAKSGPWSLVTAFTENELNYDEFYLTHPVDQAFTRLDEELAEDGSVRVGPELRDTLRWVRSDEAELRPNVIQITVESLSAEFLGTFNSESKLTPNLDALARESLLFTRFYATGTRTDRGMEALTLSLPPTPGRSIVKRPRNERLFTLGSVFRSRGYDTAFIYGGYSYFDDMKRYFGGNGYRVVDRASVADSDVTFANAWGACDEDLFRWTLREADAAHASGRPFHFFVMTTSNHRPFTYPDGRIDLPPKTSGRAGAVKYTDHAIGELLRAAAEKPWYRDTVFVIVADHCASSAGKTDLPVARYHVPLMIHAPGGHVAPGRVDTMTSQMDYAPTLLGLLHWTYASRFLGHDVARIDPTEAHALIATYQDLGHLENGELLVLKPRRRVEEFAVDPETSELTPRPPSAYAEAEAVAFYESASWLFRNGRYDELTPSELRRHAKDLAAYP